MRTDRRAHANPRLTEIGHNFRFDRRWRTRWWETL